MAAQRHWNNVAATAVFECATVAMEGIMWRRAALEIRGFWRHPNTRIYDFKVRENPQIRGFQKWYKKRIIRIRGFLLIPRLG